MAREFQAREDNRQQPEYERPNNDPCHDKPTSLEHSHENRPHNPPPRDAIQDCFLSPRQDANDMDSNPRALADKKERPTGQCRSDPSSVKRICSADRHGQSPPGTLANGLDRDASAFWENGEAQLTALV